LHRDLKPANLLVNVAGELKATDFGISRSLSETATRLTGRADETSGTLPYLSPRQVRGRKPTAADDVYALGVTLYELLTGKPPFHSVDITHQVLEENPENMEARLAELGYSGEPIPLAWEQTIFACLAKEPNDRPQNAGEVVERLGQVSAPNAQRSVWSHDDPAADRTSQGRRVSCSASDPESENKKPVSTPPFPLASSSSSEPATIFGSTRPVCSTARSRLPPIPPVGD
jgi:serine/threonine protein kinase